MQGDLYLCLTNTYFLGNHVYGLCVKVATHKYGTLFLGEGLNAVLGKERGATAEQFIGRALGKLQEGSTVCMNARTTSIFRFSRRTRTSEFLGRLVRRMIITPDRKKRTPANRISDSEPAEAMPKSL